MYKPLAPRVPPETPLKAVTQAEKSLASVSLPERAPLILNPQARTGLILLCDHASNHVPVELNTLELAQHVLDQHVAWDIGAAAVTRLMAEMMGGSAILAEVSRLVIDVNRSLDHAGLIPPVSDGIIIPGNRGLDADAAQARVDAYYTPFHDAVRDLIDAHIAAGVTPFIVGIHSFTPMMGAKERPWHMGLMWNEDAALAQAVMGIVERETDLNIGANQPYSGRDLYHSMKFHGEARGLRPMIVEIRQDLVETPAHIEEWAVLLANTFDECMSRADLAVG